MNYEPSVSSGHIPLLGYRLIWFKRKYWHTDELGFDDKGDFVVPVRRQKTYVLWIEKK